MALKKFLKDPNARLDYTIDWSAWLSPYSDTIASATVPNKPTGLTVETTGVSNAITNTATQSTFWASGGTAGTSYDVTVHITTAAGREDDRTITITCKDM